MHSTQFVLSEVFNTSIDDFPETVRYRDRTKPSSKKKAENITNNKARPREPHPESQNKARKPKNTSNDNDEESKPDDSKISENSAFKNAAIEYDEGEDR